MKEATFRVYGVAQPQGSKTVFVRGNRAVLVDGRRKESREAFAGWRSSIATAASDWQTLQGGSPVLFDGPLELVATFYLPRPKSAPKSRLYPDSRPDLDKLTRALLDGLTGTLVADDSRFVGLDVAKRFSDPGDAPYASVTVSRKLT